MDSQDQMNNNKSRGSQIWAGMFLLLVGAVILMHQLSFSFLPYWIFSWPMILIAIGLFVGIRHNFHGPGWLILIVLGSIFLADDAFPDYDFRRFIGPAIIISVGLILILRPRNRNTSLFGYERRWQRHRWRDQSYSGPDPSNSGFRNPEPENSSSSSSSSSSAAGHFDDRLDSVAIFGGVHRVILSKDFKGGETTSVFGGTEIDLSQADIQGTVVLEMVQVMGGAKLIVPAHWYVKNQINAVLGGVADKRQVRPTSIDPDKVLILKGVSFLGGLEIRNY